MAYASFHHHIQAEIYSKLRDSSKLRYKDLKEPGLEPSQFMYHLKELIKQKLVQKNADGSYSLAPAGVELAQHFSKSKGNINDTPLAYTLIFLRTTDNRWFIIRRARHPHFNKYACISSKINMGETLHDAAKRVLTEQTKGAVQADLEYRGFVSVMVRNQEVLTHITGPLWFADNVEPVDLKDYPYAGEISWVHWEKLTYDEFIPGWREIIAMIETGSPGYLDLHFINP